MNHFYTTNSKGDRFDEMAREFSNYPEHDGIVAIRKWLRIKGLYRKYSRLIAEIEAALDLGDMDDIDNAYEHCWEILEDVYAEELSDFISAEDEKRTARLFRAFRK